MIVVPLDRPNTRDPIEDVLGGHAQPTAVYLAGRDIARGQRTC
jgi:hypothetical protein